MRIQLGLKAWSTNLELIDKAELFYAKGQLDYIELFCVPNSFEDTYRAWASTSIPFVIHAPHSMAGLNLSIPQMEKNNANLSKESFHMADVLHADTVIFHPGVGGTIEETIRQAKLIRDPRMIFENKPFEGLEGSQCVGSLPDEILRLTEALEVGFCLDFGHAIVAANSHGFDPLFFISSFMELGPVMFHLTDGDYQGRHDRHYPYGNGNFPLKKLLLFVTDGQRVTNEAKRANNNSLDDYIVDRLYIEKLLPFEG